MNILIPTETIEKRIFLIRGQKVMLDRDLAQMYRVETRTLNQAVRRNLVRFPDDFMFSLTREEIRDLSQIVISSGFKHAPNVFAFTEHGIAMLSSVLRSKRAIQINIAIMRAFVKLRQILATHKELAQRLGELEERMDRKDREIISLFEAIRKLMAPPPPEPAKGKIGFQ